MKNTNLSIDHVLLAPDYHVQYIMSLARLCVDGTVLEDTKIKGTTFVLNDDGTITIQMQVKKGKTWKTITILEVPKKQWTLHTKS